MLRKQTFLFLKYYIDFQIIGKKNSHPIRFFEFRFSFNSLIINIFGMKQSVSSIFYIEIGTKEKIM